MTTKTKRPEPGSIEDLKEKADKALEWRQKRHPKAPMDLVGFSRYFAATQYAHLTEKPMHYQWALAEGAAVWWRTLASFEAYWAHVRAEQAHARVLAEDTKPRRRRAA